MSIRSYYFLWLVYLHSGVFKGKRAGVVTGPVRSGFECSVVSRGRGIGQIRVWLKGAPDGGRNTKSPNDGDLLGYDGGGRSRICFGLEIGFVVVRSGEAIGRRISKAETRGNRSAQTF